MSEQYVIRVRGILGPLLRRTFDEMACEPLPKQSTLRGELSDDDLRRVLKLLDGCGLQLVHVDDGRTGPRSSLPGEPHSPRPGQAGHKPELDC